MLRIFTCMSFAVLLLTVACKKGNPVEVKSFGFLELELVTLPDAPILEIYIQDTKLADSLRPGIILGDGNPVVVPSEKSTRVSFRKKGSDAVLLDTSIIVPAGQKRRLRLVVSEEMGLKNFLKGNGNVAPDSSSFQLYNALPKELQEDSLLVDAVILKNNPNTGGMDEVAVLPNFSRTKLHSKSITVPLKENDEEIRYYLKLRNAKTGEILVDQIGQDFVNLRMNPGKEQIFSLIDLPVDFGDGTFAHMFEIQTAIL